MVGLVGALVDLKSRGHSMVAPSVRAFGVDSVLEPLFALCEHKSRSKAVPALELLKLVLQGSAGAGSRAQAAIKTASTAAQMSDQTIRKAALECLVILHGLYGDSVLEACAPLMRAPILASLRDMIAAAGPPAPQQTPMKKAVVSAPLVEKENNAVRATPSRGVSEETWAGAFGGLAASSWKERLAAVEKTQDLLNRSSSGESEAHNVLEELVRLQGGLTGDSHSVVVAKSLALLGTALGLASESSVTSFSKRVCLLLLDRLKDNGKTLVAAADEVLHAVPVEAGDLVELTAVILAFTVPKQRQKGIEWLQDLLAQNEKAWLRPVLRPVCTQAGEAFNDSSADVRRAAAGLLQLLAGRWGQDTVSAVLFGESGVVSRMGAARQAQVKKLIAEAPEIVSEMPSPQNSPLPAAVVQMRTRSPTPVKKKPRAAPTTQIPAAPKVSKIASVSKEIPSPAISVVSEPVAVVVAAAPVSSSSSSSSSVEEWRRMSAFVETQLRTLQSEQTRSSALAQRCRTAEADNATLRRHCAELEEVAVALEDRAVELEAEAEAQETAGMISQSQIDQMTIEELSAAEVAHQEVLASIVQRKRKLVERMAKKNGCSACGKARTKSTALFPCRHVVCSPCGAELKSCPDCNEPIQQRFELAD